MKSSLIFLVLPLVAISDVQNDMLLQLQDISAHTGWLINMHGEYNDDFRNLLTKSTDIETVLKTFVSPFSMIKEYLYDIQQHTLNIISPKTYSIANNMTSLITWWNEQLADKVTRTTDQFYYFLKDDADPYELNEYHVWRLNSDPGDMSPLREFEPYVRPHNFSTTFKDYFEDYSNNHLEILSYNNKLLADIAMSLAPTGKQYRVTLPYFGVVGSTVDFGWDWWFYLSSFGQHSNLDDLFQIVSPGSVQDEYFNDPHEAILAVLSQSYDMQASFTFPLLVMITNQQAIISQLTHTDTSFTNQLATTVSEDTADPGKYDTELDGVISSLNIEESSFFSGFKDSFSAPSSASLSFQMPQSVVVYLGEFMDIHFPTIDIDTSGYSRFFAILRKCMIAFWGVMSFAFWASVFKLFVFISAKFALFFGPQVSDGLGKS